MFFFFFMAIPTVDWFNCNEHPLEMKDSTTFHLYLNFIGIATPKLLFFLITSISTVILLRPTHCPKK